MHNKKQIVKKDVLVPVVSQDPLESIELSKEQVKQVLIGAGVKSIAENVPIFNKLFGVIERVNEEVKEEKLRMLLSQFQSHFDDHDKAFNQLKTLFGSRAGLILFQKIFHILETGDADQEWIDLLAKALKKVSEDDIESQFTERSYVLSQIAKLSPHALVILSKQNHWRRVSFSGSTTMSGQTIVGGWENQASTFFSSQTGVSDTAAKARIAHAFLDLQSAGMIHITESKSLAPTAIGAEVYKSIT